MDSLFTLTTVLEKRIPDESMFGSQSHTIPQRQIRSLILKLFAAESFLLPLPAPGNRSSYIARKCTSHIVLVIGDMSFSFVTQLQEDEKYSVANHASDTLF